MNDISTNASEYSVSGFAYMKSVLLRLFLYYSNSLDHTKASVLSYSNFLQVLKDANLITEAFTIESANLLIHRYLKQRKVLKFSDFCDILLPLSHALYGEEFLINKAECLFKLLSQHISPLHSALVSRGLILNLELDLTPPVLQLLASVNKYLEGLYKLYFPWETKSAQSLESLKKLSEKALLTLVGKYNVYPEIITRSLFKIIWENLMECPPGFVSLIPGDNYGKVLKFKKFVAFFVISANFGSFTGKAESLYERALMLLENMEICSGRNEISGGSVVVSRVVSAVQSPRVSVGRARDVRTIYNSLRFSGVKKEITAKKVKDLLENIGVVCTNFNEIDMIFRNTCKGGVDFERFEEILARISIRICKNNSEEELVAAIINSQWYQRFAYRIEDSLQRICKEELSEITELWRKSLTPYLKFYCKAEESIGIKDLQRFSIDFSLFPQVITKKTLDETFYLFCIQDNVERLELNNSLTVLIICAVQSFIPDLTDAQKLRSVLERIWQSDGFNKITIKTGINRPTELLEAADSIISTKSPPKSLNTTELTFDSFLSSSPQKPRH